MTRRHSWFLPENPDVLGLLRRQGELTSDGMDALCSWAAGDAEAAARLRETEHQADEVKRLLRLALRDAFITPIGAEDLFVLSERLDAVLNGAKDAVRESELMALPPDLSVTEMAEFLREGIYHLADAFTRLAAGQGSRNEAESATDAADAAVKAQRQLERVYRRAMSDLLAIDDLREVIGRRELYRRFSRLSEIVEQVAERVWYAAVKEA